MIKLTRKQTGLKLPSRVSTSFAEYEITNHGPNEFQRPSFGVDNEYSLEVRAGINFVANKLELEHAADSALIQARHFLYKDVITEVHKALSCAGNQECQEILSSLLDKITKGE